MSEENEGYKRMGSGTNINEISVFKKPGSQEYVVRPPYVRVSRKNPMLHVTNLTEGAIDFLVPSPGEGFTVTSIGSRCGKCVELPAPEQIGVVPFSVYCREQSAFAVGESNPIIIFQD